jgi:hypothetical protein
MWNGEIHIDIGIDSELARLEYPDDLDKYIMEHMAPRSCQCLKPCRFVSKPCEAVIHDCSCFPVVCDNYIELFVDSFDENVFETAQLVMNFPCVPPDSPAVDFGCVECEASSIQVDHKRMLNIASCFKLIRVYLLSDNDRHGNVPKIQEKIRFSH